jgi:branched-chain amino acid transport system permease protein
MVSFSPSAPVLGVLLLALLVMGLVAVVGALLERTAYRPLRESPRLSAVVSALGASIFFQNAVMLIYGARLQVYPQGILPRTAVNLFGLYLPLVKLLILLASVVIMAALYLYIHKTRIGTAIRAAAIDQGAARLMGIDVDRVILIVFLIGPALGGLAGLMVGLLYGQINFTMGWVYGLKAFTAAILGGIGNIPGAMVGGILLGVIEAMGAAYISIAWKDAIHRKIIYGVVTALLVMSPLFLNKYWVDVLNNVGLYAILGLSLNIIVGHAGLFNLGHAAFYAVGAYTAAILNTRFNIPVLWLLPLCALSAGLFAAIVMRPIIHLRGDYLCIVTIGLGEIVRIALINDVFGITGGANGIFGIDRDHMNFIISSGGL